MPSQIHHRSYGWYRTAVPCHRASEPLHLRISLCLSSVHGQPELPEPPHRNLHTDLTSAQYALLLPQQLHGQCGPPAIRTLWNVKMVWLSSPSELRNTTGCIPLEGHGKTGCPLRRNRRTESRRSVLRTDVPAALLIHRELPMPPLEQSPLRDLSPSPVSSLE